MDRQSSTSRLNQRPEPVRPRSLAEARLQVAAAKARLRLLTSTAEADVTSGLVRKYRPWLALAGVVAGVALLKVVPLRTAIVAMIAKRILGDAGK